MSGGDRGRAERLDGLLEPFDGALVDGPLRDEVKDEGWVTDGASERQAGPLRVAAVSQFSQGSIATKAS